MSTYRPPVPVLLAVALVLGSAVARAQSSAFTYQGKLQDGSSPATGAYDLRFRLFDAASGGSQLGATLCNDNVAVTDGTFSVQLDFGQQFATTDARFLEVAVRRDTGLDCGNGSGFTALAPRQQVTAAPLAIHAAAAFALGAPDGSPANAVVVDDNGNVGIGVANPGFRLRVASAFPSDGVSVSGTAPNAPAFSLATNGFGDSYLGAATANQNFSADAVPGDLVLLSPSSRKLLLQNGFSSAAVAIVGSNVGIGTASPTTKLDVRGNIRLGDAGQYYAPSGQENLRIIRGTVNGSGVITAGGFFSVQVIGSGSYRIVFDVPFTSAPTVCVTAAEEGQGPVLCVTDGVSTTAATIRRFFANADYAPQAGSFQFTATGPR